MGREAKRVPLDFAWPLDKVWAGYVCPYQPAPCSACEGQGWSPEYRALKAAWNPWYYHLDADDVAALIAGDCLWDFTRVRRPDTPADAAQWPNGWLKESNGYVPTVTEVNTWARGDRLGLSESAAYHVIKAKLARLGLSDKCAVCHGEGTLDLAAQARQEAWERTDPPTGEGWQLWETTSEGSPQSPVFTSLRGLARWCEAHATTFGDARATVDEWERMLAEGCVVHREGNIIFM